jgi:hypothetical protein
MTDAKAQQFVSSIVKGVNQELTESFAQIHRQMAEMMVVLNGIDARLATLEAPASVAAKRAVRAAAGVATDAPGPAKKSEPKTSANILVFFKQAIAANYADLRTKYATPVHLAKLTNVASITKKEKEKETKPDAYWTAVAHELWKLLTPSEKEGVRALHQTWKEQQARDAADLPLEEDKP